MKKRIRRISAVLFALTMVFVLTVGAAAAFVTTPKKGDIEGTIIGDITADGFTVSMDLTADKPKSIQYYLTGDALNSEFWNRTDAYVEIDITLNSDSSSVYAVLPAFTTDWSWVNPSVWDTYLKKGSTVTLREPLSVYYNSFSEKKPLLLRLQICTNAESETVEITTSAIRFVGVDDVEDTTDTGTGTGDDSSTVETTPAETQPEDTEPEESQPEESDPEESEPEESDPEESEPEQTTITAATTSKPADDTAEDDRPVTTTTAPSQTTTRAPVVQDNTNAADGDPGDITGIVIVIVIVAVVVIVGGVVGFIIYRKKKYY